MSNLKVEGKVGDFCLNCKNCKGITKEHDGKNASIRITEVECEDPYDGMVKTLDVDSDICCSMFEATKEKGPFNLNMPSRIISEEKYNELKKSSDSWRERYYDIRYALRKDESLDESISCVRDIPSDVEMIKDLKKRAADSDYYKEKSELLEERNDKQFNTIREKNKKISELRVYADENEKMYKELQEWREKCISRGNDIDHLLSENKEKDKKISDLEARVNYWSNKAVAHSEKLTDTRKDRDKWRELYNSLSEACADYDKRCKEECEKKYRNEISKLQNIVTEKEVEIRGLRKDNVYLNQNKVFADAISEKNESLEAANKGLRDKVGSLKNKIVSQQATHYKQCARILDLENMVSKLQSGEYDDILAKDIEIKSLHDKYEAAMTGWKDAIDTNDKSQSEIENLTKAVDELTRRYNMIAKKLNDIHDILKEDPNNA